MAQGEDQYEDVTEIPSSTIDLTADVFASKLNREEIAAIDEPTGDQSRARSEVGLRMSEIAEGQIGVRESGGENGGVPLTRYVRRFWPNSGPQPWCALFPSWCCVEATGRRPARSNPGLVDSVRAWALTNNRLVRTPCRGDMFGIGGHTRDWYRGPSARRSQ